VAEHDQPRQEPLVDLPRQPRLDKALSFCEALTAFFVTGVIWLGLVAMLYWVVFGADAQTRLDAVHVRLVEVLKQGHENWKVGLLLLIPLFYRPVRMFLLLVEEAWGVKTGPRTPGKQQTRPNPPVSADDADA
jgi:hypothetical protein